MAVTRDFSAKLLLCLGGEPYWVAAMSDEDLLMQAVTASAQKREGATHRRPPHTNLDQPPIW